MSTTDRFEFYRDKAGEHRWRRTAPNGRIVGASTEGYKACIDAIANATRNGYTPDTSGFYTFDGTDGFYAPNFVYARDYELLRELHATYTYPVHGWWWRWCKKCIKPIWR